MPLRDKLEESEKRSDVKWKKTESYFREWERERL